MFLNLDFWGNIYLKFNTWKISYVPKRLILSMFEKTVSPRKIISCIILTDCVSKRNYIKKLEVG
jgi:hypothetical protein